MVLSKPIGRPSSSDESGDARIRSLQRQLNDLKGASFKVLPLARIKADEEARGLIDSDATHALRPQMPGGSIGHYSQVHVTLAGDKKMVMIAGWSDCGSAECGAHSADGSVGQESRVHFAMS